MPSASRTESPSLEVAHKRLASLPQALKHIAQFLLEYPEFAITASAREIAKATDTSDASVIRTAHALGFDGLKPLRRALTESLTYETDPAQIMRRKVSRAEHADTLHNTVVDTESSLQYLLEPDFMANWSKAVQLLHAAESVLCYGLKPVGFVAEYLSFMLGRIGIRSRALTETGVSLADQLVSLTVSTAVIFAPLRVFKEVATVVSHLKAQNAQIILITERQQHPLRAEVSVLLRTPRTATTSSAGEITMPVVIAQALSTSLATIGGNRARSALEVLTAIRKQL